MNDYYQGLINDNNITLAVQDLISRDEEITSLKSRISELESLTNAPSMGNFTIDEEQA
jgi:hypothetical protein